MSQLKHLNDALAYIEEHLDGTLDTGEVARIAACSAYQLKRMFPYLAGITLSEYVRRRAMTRAAQDLLATDEKVIDIALRYGYESPTAFSKAFRRVHGMSPSDVRQPGAKVTLHPRLIFTLSVKGEEPMDYRIIEQSAFRVVGIPSANGKWDLEDAGAKAAEYWEELGTDVHKVVNLMDGSEPAGLLGVQFCKDGDFDCYMACVATNQPCPNEMEERVVAAATYAVFECEGAMPDAMNDLWHRILTEWLPSSGYEWESKTDVERYLTPNMISPDSRSEVWLPVVKR
ncbi:MAG: AraC family transcriptional regulator [Eggerthellaceae bacterium]